METLTIDHNNGHKSVYNLHTNNEKSMPIAYSAKAPQALVDAIERARKNNQRVRVYRGDIETGKCWNEEWDITGYIGLSKGSKAYFPLLVNNARSMGGGSLMENCIIKIKESKGGHVLYQAPNFQQPIIEIKEGSKVQGYAYELYINVELHANLKTLQEAERLKKKML